MHHRGMDCPVKQGNDKQDGLMPHTPQATSKAIRPVAVLEIGMW